MMLLFKNIHVPVKLFLIKMYIKIIYFDERTIKENYI
jgi:hypothetical protein